ncbi:cardiolipin synthase ClsB [Piscinibacter sakaiensis]|uniref:Cardiolipin synthase B n=1 Tax=Piscinibacter sakaiensis TaxID=1547922 RepID=A0A0K8P2R5_PISS1|nr:cardiolipin synthase ClsB [Piscinibacter sakaiensis]GAP36921.1 cardiolipin synthetase [Piscinibacter sakaiensis]
MTPPQGMSQAGAAPERSAAGRPLRRAWEAWRRRRQGPAAVDGSPDFLNSARWLGGHRITLLENGEAFFPRVFEAIEAARDEVLIETFILFDDKVGRGLQAALLAAAGRGVRVALTVDGYGSPDLPPDFVDPLTAAGVRFLAYDPAPRLFGWRPNMLRRLHRKLVVIDGERAFVGGINYSADHLADFGPQAKQDYAIEVEGPLVATIHHFLRAAQRVAEPSRRWLRRTPASPAPAPAGSAEAMFVTRDNRDHASDIERHYRAAIRAARRRVVIANAYFFPGYRLIRELRRAARRGVEVILILQGEPDMPIVRTAASTLYDHLLRAGVRIFEYCERPLHGKVAVIDGVWSTVGSSNLDPLSLSLNLEANVMVRDPAFAAQLEARLDHLMQHACREIDAAALAPSGAWSVIRNTLVFHFLRHFPRWAPRLPTLVPHDAVPIAWAASAAGTAAATAAGTTAAAAAAASPGAEHHREALG